MDCGVRREEAPNGFISTRGLCGPCGLKRQLDNIDGIEQAQGVPYARWRLGMAIAILPTEVVGELYKAGMFEATAA